MLRPETFRHQTVRDLVWLLTAPPMCHCTAESWQIPTPCKDTLVQLDRNPQPLLQWLARHPTRLLGHYHEQLWLFYFHLHPQLELIASNRIIQGETRTLGEFDVLLKDHRDGLIWHLELAVKFYLGTLSGWGEADQWSHWLGVACRDSMEHKWQRLIQQQLTLSRSPEVQACLQQQGLPVPQRASSLTRGCLFYPETELSDSPLPAPKQMNPQHLKGRWLHLKQFEQHYKNDNRAQWRICSKPHWLAPVADAHWLSALQLIPLLSQQLAEPKAGAEPEKKNKRHNRRPQRGTEGVLLEHRDGSRLFVVSNHWPGYQPLPWHRLQGRN